MIILKNTNIKTLQNYTKPVQKPNLPKIIKILTFTSQAHKNQKYHQKKGGAAAPPCNPEGFVRYEKFHSYTPHTGYP